MGFIDATWQDARRGLRALGRTPAFTAAAILTLTLGIGATTAIFTVVNAVLLAQLPYQEPDRRVMIWSRWVSFDKTWLSGAEVLDYRRLCKTLADVAAWGTRQVNLTGDGDPVRVTAAAVTANTFSVLGTQPLAGRVFAAEEDVAGRDRVVVLTYGLWQRRYAGDAAAIGQSVFIDGQPRQIIGVMPPGFQLPTDFTEDAAEPSQLFVPLAIDTAAAQRGNHGLYGAAQLAPGATAESATAELRAVTANLTREGLYPAPMQFSAFANPLEKEIRGTIRPALLLVMGAVQFLLLIACVNVANLLFVRADARQRELAVRTALGASPGQIVRQLVTESLLLATASAVLGLALAVAGVRVLLAISPDSLPRLAPIGVDVSVLAFTALIAVVTTLVFGIAPAVRAARVDLHDSLKEGGQRGTASLKRQRVRAVLVIGEMALAVVLVIGAGLMLRSLAALQRIDLGFNPDRVLTVRLALPQASYDTPEKVNGFYSHLLERARQLPHVRSAGLVRSLPLADTIGDWGLAVEGFVAQPGQSPKGDWQVVSDGAIETMGEHLLRGRSIAATDTADGQQVALINETMARAYWPNTDPIGRRFRMGSPDRPWITVVGLVADERHNGVTTVVKEKFYRPIAQFHRSSGNPIRNVALVIKTEGAPLELAAPIRTLVRSLDPNLPLADVRTLEDIVRSAIATPRLTGFLLGTFAVLALALASIGIYGVLAYLVSQRAHEIGIRLAIGASGGDMLRMVLVRGVALAIAGIAIGLAGSLALTRVMSALLYGIRPIDPVTYGGVPLLLFCVSLLASYIPARRAMRTDPMTALRTE